MSLDRLKDSLHAFEGACSHPYLDTKAIPTTGVGHAMQSLAEMQALPWERAGLPATAKDVEIEYHRLLTLERGQTPTYYAMRTLLRLPKDAISALLDSDIAAKQAEVTASIPGFTSLPEPVQVALLDMAFNLGTAGLLKFTHLIASVKLGDWANCAAECHRLDIGEARNAWTARLFLEAGVPRT